MTEWTDDRTRILIDERKNKNEEYHNLGRNRLEFWNSIATKINTQHSTNFNRHQYKEKFANLVRDYNSVCEYMSGRRKARRSRAGVKYFDEFRTHFWERPEDSFDRIRNMNISNRRQNRRSSLPVPSIDEIEWVLGQRGPLGTRSSSQRSRWSRSNQRSRTHSESPSRNPSQAPSSAHNDDDVGNPRNIGANTATAQPPTYKVATDDQQFSSNAEGIQMVSDNIMRKCL